MHQIPQHVRAVRVAATGDANTLVVENIPTPVAGVGEVLVRVEWAGVNFLDVYKRSGQYQVPLPFTSGEEGAGTVVALGADVNGLSVGSRVAWSSVMGSYAEYVVAPANRLVLVPANVDTKTAAAVMLQGMTAHYLATSTYPLTHNASCVIHAAAGGVGLLLVQIAKRRGAFVIATAGSDEKLELSRRAGADVTVNYTSEDFVKVARDATGGRGVHVVYDSVGESTFMRGLDALAPRGMMVLFGQSSGPVAPFDPQVLNRKGSLFLTRPSLGAYIATREELEQRSGELFDWIADGTLYVRIGAHFPLDQAPEAHRALEGRRTTGKVLLEVAAT